jgi:Phage integrase, N-terminal SAM-like domain
MTRLRQMMPDELERRNYTQNTKRAYLHAVADFARHFHRSPEQLGLDHIRDYQVHLFRTRRLKANSVTVHLAALRFVFVAVLKRRWPVDDTVSEEARYAAGRGQPRGGHPTHRSCSHAAPSAHFNDPVCHRIAAHGAHTPQDWRCRLCAHGDSRPRRQGSQGPRRDAQPRASGSLAAVLAGPQA